MQITEAGDVKSSTQDRQTRLSKTFAYYAAFIVLGLAASMFGPTLTGLSRQTRSTLEQLSIVFVMRSSGYLIGSILAGRLYDRVKGHTLMVGVLLGLVTCVALVPVIPLLWLLCGVVLLLGLFEGLVDVGGNTLLVWVHRAGSGPFMNGLHFFFGVGAFLSPIIIAQAVLISGNIYWAFWALAILMLPAAIWLSRLPSPEPMINHPAEALRPALPILILLIALFDFVYVGMEISYGSWVSTYALKLHLADEINAAYLASAFWGALTAGRLVSIPAATRLPSRTILAIDLAIVALSVILVLVFPGSLLVLWIGTFGAGFGMASMFPTMLTLAGSHMTITGNITSWVFVGASLGGMVLPWVIGQLFNTFGPTVTMWMVLISTGVDMVIFGVMMAYIRTLKE